MNGWKSVGNGIRENNLASQISAFQILAGLVFRHVEHVPLRNVAKASESKKSWSIRTATQTDVRDPGVAVMKHATSRFTFLNAEGS